MYAYLDVYRLIAVKVCRMWVCIFWYHFVFYLVLCGTYMCIVLEYILGVCSVSKLQLRTNESTMV